MKTMKTISVIIIAILLFIAESLVMGLFAVDKAISEDSVKKAMQESGIVPQLVEEALSEATVNMAGEYGEKIEAVFRTDAMSDFLSSYAAAAISTELYGSQYEEIADDELMKAFSDGIDEVNQSGEYSISIMEEELLKQAMQQEIPDLTAALNEQAGAYEALDGEAAGQALDEDFSGQTIMNPVAKLLIILLCALFCAALIALCWRSRLGFLWCGIILALVSVIYLSLYTLLGGFVSSSAADQMMYSMMRTGFEGASTVGLVISAVFFIAFIIFKITSRRKKHEEDIETTERFA